MFCPYPVVPSLPQWLPTYCPREKGRSSPAAGGRFEPALPGGLFNIAKPPYRQSRSAPYEFGALREHL